MKCAVCGKPTRVLETRAGEHGTVQRRRECSNSNPHRFTTFEIEEPAFRNVAYRVGRYARARDARVELWRRDEEIIRDPRSSRQLAAVYGLHPGHIRRIRRLQI
ncbi:NrdR family transcriptional regulator [Variovorax sp. PBS-H4]|uniref:NrdR family transcriptional regulator n=1 Tax=Variovorax sp. PBS-H4 TaxID=434008 RepID=UPI003FCD416A